MSAGTPSSDWTPPEQLPVKDQWNHPFTGMLRQLGYEIREEYPGEGHRTLFGMVFDMKYSRITYLIAEENTILAIYFQRLQTPDGLLSPLREFQQFFALASDPRTGLEKGMGKIKVQNSAGRHLSPERLARAYRRCFDFQIFGYEHGFPWVGTTAEQYRKIIIEQNIPPMPPAGISFCQS